MRDLLYRALHSILAESSSYDAEIIVVDNASQDGTVEMLHADFPAVRLIANSQNAGFTRANNQALAVAQGQYLYLLNPDTEIVKGALPALTEYMDSAENSRVGIVGPRLLNPDQSLQSSRRRFPTFATALLESPILQQWFPRNRWLSRYYMQDTSDEKVQDVDWVVGAAMLVRRSLFEQIGGLDERFFMYSEELDWCYRAKQAGWRVVYFPRAQIIHHEAKSSGQALAQRDIYFHSSKVRFFGKYHGAVESEILRWFLLATFSYQLLAEGAKWLVGHKRPLRATRVRAYRQVLRSGLK